MSKVQSSNISDNQSRFCKLTLENTEGAIKNEQYRETCKLGYTRRKKTNQKYNTICVGEQYTRTNTNNVITTQSLLQATNEKDDMLSQKYYRETNCIACQSDSLSDETVNNIDVTTLEYIPLFIFG